MIRRFLVGLVVGLAVGSAFAAALIFGLKVTTFDGHGGVLLAYASAALTGAFTGLVAGKPIWKRGGRVEAGLKAFFGAFLAFGGMFAMHRWLHGWTIDLRALHAGGPEAADVLPAVCLPLLAAVLGALFELDNTGEAEPSPSSDTRSGKSAGQASAGPR